MEDRGRAIARASMVSMLVNAALSVMKAVIGIVTGSIAILLDAVNSLADVFGAVITLVGARLAGRNPDERHPFGYGRAEYLASITIAAVILAAGISSLVEAVKSIIHPNTPEYTTVALVFVGIASVAKGVLGLYLRSVGKKAGAVSLVGSGVDAIMDAFVSVSTLVAAIIFITTGISVESWLAAGIALLVTKNGVEMLRETISKVLGERPDLSMVNKVEQVALSVEGVDLVSAIVLQDYGPEALGGSLHVSVDGNMTVAELRTITRKVQEAVQNECGVIIVSVGAYPTAHREPSTSQVRAIIGRIVWGHKKIIELRGLFVDMETRHVSFDAIADFGVEGYLELRDEIVALCEEELPDWVISARVLPNLGN